MYDDKEYHKKYYQENKEKIKARSKAYRKANREKLSEYNRKWRENHPNYFKQYAMGDLL